MKMTHKLALQQFFLVFFDGWLRGRWLTWRGFLNLPASQLCRNNLLADCAAVASLRTAG